MNRTKNKYSKFFRIIALFLAFNFTIEAVAPICVYATGGPSQPEVQSFMPVETNDMVDLFTGDFHYNIPLFDVDGYPINLIYNSGITMDQEASWVGLGWNLNPGAITRTMRGLPDDFNGDIVEKELNMKPNRTYGLSFGRSIELVGIENLKLSHAKTYGLKFNNYNGFDLEKSINNGISFGQGGKTLMTANLGLSASSDGGIEITPSVSFLEKIDVGAAISSREGLKTITINPFKLIRMNQSFVRGPNIKGFNFNFVNPTYIPQISHSMKNFSISGNYQLGGEFYGVYINGKIGGYYSGQKLAQNQISNPAYGYIYSEHGQNLDNALLDFNREKDGSFTKFTPALPLTNFTYDVYTVSGQGVGGSYKPNRSDLGYVFDASSSTTSGGFSTGAETGAGNALKIGVDVNVTYVESHSGKWKSENLAEQSLKFRNITNDILYEPFYFKEANEKTIDTDPAFYGKIGHDNPVKISLNPISKFNVVADIKYSDNNVINPKNYRSQRDIRNQTISVLTKKEILKFGTDPSYESQICSDAKDHHIAEITVNKTDGARYVYGLPAYNTKYCEVTFAIGSQLYGLSNISPNAFTGLLKYNEKDNSGENKHGLDNYFSKTALPPYAHSYLLTTILSSDYIDSDDIQGPSDNDLGHYTKFNYTKIENYKWRTPVEKLSATHNEGLKSLTYDDKGNYLYGEKELFYLQSIESKNQIAIFHTESRKDGLSVNNEDGGLNTDNSKATQLLKKISLYSKPDYFTNGTQAKPIKEIHFVYDYSLCPEVPTNNSTTSGENGKLTLKEVYFTFQNSKKGSKSRYQFNYSDFNPSYNIRNYDRWGFYKENFAKGFDPLTDNLSTADFPYVEQDKALADKYASAWTLTDVKLPNGGNIKVTYESDDYAYVQNKKASQMFKVVGIDRNDNGITNVTSSYTSVNLNGVDAINDLANISNAEPLKLIIKLQEPVFSDYIFWSDYIRDIGHLYFKFLMKIKGSKYEYVSGYIEEKDIVDYGVYPGEEYAWIAVKQVTTNDVGVSKVSPMTKAAIQFGRINLPREVWSVLEKDEITDAESFGKDILIKIMQASMINNLIDAALGANEALYIKYFVGWEAVMNKSWIRLWNPNGKKLGGGCRVKKVEMNDSWNLMTSYHGLASQYGWEYEYIDNHGNSSGVAAYEPLIGGDENSFRKPVMYVQKNLLVPDDQFFMEEPFGESFFPAPVVGYSKVTVKNIQRKYIKRHATGKTVHEFFTTKDFPTVTDRTSILPLERHKSSPFGLSALFNIEVKDYMTASQGYVVKLNDMSGKPKSQTVYQENNEMVSSVEYKYKTFPYLENSFQPDFRTTVITKEGKVQENVPTGRSFDYVADFRENKSYIMSPSIQFNLDVFFIGPFPLFPFTIIPSYSSERTQFRSAVVTKVIHQFGTLDETIATDLGSVVSTKNIAYDAESGEVLLTKTTTNFNDSVFNLKFPAYWHYENMGPAYQNIGLKTRLEFSANGGKAAFSNAHKYFAEGDEISLSENEKAWVYEVTTSDVSAILKNGSRIVTPQDVKIYRSGKRNQQQVNMATITTLKNPLDNVKNNIYEEVLQAEAIEFTNNWRTYCDCIPEEILDNFFNPFVSGTKGYWKPKRTFMYHTDRTQVQVNNNTDIRHDGLFSSFNPFYNLSGNKWLKDEKNWVFTAEATEFSPFGQQLENRDALERYSSDVFGYNHSLQLLSSANAQYKEVGADNFEDYNFSECADIHFKFKCSTCPKPTSAVSHTGQYSMKISAGSPLAMQKSLVACELRDCSLEITEKSDTNMVTLTMSDGVPPYMVDWEITNGSPVINIDDAGKVVTINGSGNYEVELTAIDAYGCKEIKTVVK